MINISTVQKEVLQYDDPFQVEHTAQNLYIYIAIKGWQSHQGLNGPVRWAYVIDYWTYEPLFGDQWLRFC